MNHRPYIVSWNLTQRCNLRCVHCYLNALPGADASGELSTSESFRVVDEMAAVNPEILLILTGGEPLLRPDLFRLAGYATQKGFTVVLGTNGILLGERQASLMRQNGIQGASISLDSIEPARHDTFRQLPGAWRGAVRATDVLRAEGLPFSLHMSVANWNTDEIPAMIDLARALGARALNLFFLVQTGRGEGLTDITPEQYERILYTLDPGSPLLQPFAGSCPAGKQYCRITPDGTVTPCPYMPVPAGRLRQQSFGDIWREARIFTDLRNPRLGGRCGACEFSGVCGGCRCRAYAIFGDYLAEDPACAYEPGAYGGRPIELPAERGFGTTAEPTLTWTVAAQARLQHIPGFARGMVIQGVERYARERGRTVITPEVLDGVRERMKKNRRRGHSPFPAASWKGIENLTPPS